MRRRELIRYAGASTALAAVGSGCLEEGSPGNETDDDVTDDDSDEKETTVTGTSFSVLSRGEGGGGDMGSVTYSLGEGTIEVTGIIIGSDACKTAELGGAEYDEDEDALIVDVETVDAEGAGDMCAEVLTPIRYEVSVEFDGNRPSVVVRHDGEKMDAGEISDPVDRDSDTSVAGSEFEVTGTGCGRETDEAEYTASQGTSEGNESTGIVEGTLSGPDSCTTAELGYVSYDREEDTLIADVRSASTDAEVCEDCITEVNYLLEATFENGVPDSAAVSHDGVRVDGIGGGIEDAAFRVEESGGGSGTKERADAEFEDDKRRILLTGTVFVKDGCATARLANATVEEGSLDVNIEKVSDGSEVCTEALVAMRYEATFLFDGEIPNEVSVSHDGQGVMSAAYGSESVSESPQSDSSE